MNETYIGLLIQVPLVGIFVWFSLRIVDIFMKSLDKRDGQWQEFLEQQRTANADAIAHMAGRFADEIKALGKEVSALRESMR